MADPTDTPIAAGAPRARSPLTRRVLFGVVVAFLAIAVLGQFVSGATSPDQSQSHPASSYDTGDVGTRGFADLLGHYGYPVRRQVGPLATATLPDDGTVFLLDAGTLTAPEAARLLDAAARGARVVIGGADLTFLGRLRDDPPRWAPVRHELWAVDTPEFSLVRRVRAAGEGLWSAPGSSQPVITSSDGTLVTEERVGLGRLVFLADTTPLDNQLIAQDDNAAFALALAGSRDREVVFTEGVHGYTGATGWRAIPMRWKLALIGLVLAAALFAWSRGVRFGPPEEAERELAPARARYLEAIGGTLQRGHDAEAARAQLAASARVLVARRGIAVDDAPIDRATAEQIAALIGAEVDDLIVLFTPFAASTDAGLVQATRAFAALHASAPGAARRTPTGALQ